MTGIDPASLALSLGVLRSSPDWAFLVQQQAAFDEEVRSEEFKSLFTIVHGPGPVSDTDRKRWEAIDGQRKAIKSYTDMFADHSEVLALYLALAACLGAFTRNGGDWKVALREGAAIISRNLRLELISNPRQKIKRLTDIFSERRPFDGAFGNAQRLTPTFKNRNPWQAALLESIRSLHGAATQVRDAVAKEALDAGPDDWLRRLVDHMERATWHFTPDANDLIRQAIDVEPAMQLRTALDELTIAQWSDLLCSNWQDAASSAGTVMQRVASIFAARALNSDWAALAPFQQLLARGWASPEKSALPKEPASAEASGAVEAPSPPSDERRRLLMRLETHRASILAEIKKLWDAPRYLILHGDTDWISRDWKVTAEVPVASLPAGSKSAADVLDGIDRSYGVSDAAPAPPRVRLYDVPTATAQDLVSRQDERPFYLIVREPQPKLTVPQIVDPKNLEDMLRQVGALSNRPNDPGPSAATSPKL